MNERKEILLLIKRAARIEVALRKACECHSHGDLPTGVCGFCIVFDELLRPTPPEEDGSKASDAEDGGGE